IDLRTQAQQIERRNSQERLFAQLSGFFGVAALMLACVGLHGLMSYLVLQRTGEMCLRLALGALPGQVLQMVLRESFTLVAVGLVLGLAVAYSVRRFVEATLFGLTAADPLTYAVVAGVLVAVTLLAALRPARRAARVYPMIARRAEETRRPARAVTPFGPASIQSRWPERRSRRMPLSLLLRDVRHAWRVLGRL